MKKYFGSLVTGIVLSISLSAQIPNAGFETWVNMTTYDDPDKWSTLNASTAASGTFTCEKGTPGSPGTSFLKLTTKTVPIVGVVPGVAVCGTINPVTMQPTGGFAFAQRPEKLVGMWQHANYGNDTGFVSVYLSRWNTTSSTRELVSATTHKFSAAVGTWEAFEIPLTYLLGATPDTCVIVLAASDISTAVANSYLYVDSLNFTGTVTGFNSPVAAISDVQVYPNPAKGSSITVEFNANTETNAVINLFNLQGSLVKTFDVNKTSGIYKTSIPTSGMSKGLYLLKISAGDATETKKLMIE